MSAPTPSICTLSPSDFLKTYLHTMPLRQQLRWKHFTFYTRELQPLLPFYFSLALAKWFKECLLFLVSFWSLCERHGKMILLLFVPYPIMHLVTILVLSDSHRAFNSTTAKMLKVRK